jgi:deoxyribonuclease V
MEHVNPRPIIVPCHRVVYGDGGLGGYGAPEGISKKIRLLKSEGVEVNHGKIVDFKKLLFSDLKLPGTPPLQKLRAEQLEMGKFVSLQDAKSIKEFNSVVGIDVSYSTEYGFGAAVLMDINNYEIIEQRTCRKATRFPYIPTYLSYHELPIAFELLKSLKNPYDAALFDGNGVLHPLGLGLAAHAGVILQKPTFGIAKKLLCGQVKDNRRKIQTIQHEIKNNIVLNEKKIGISYKPRTARTRSIFISPGNMMSFKRSFLLSTRLCKTRIPEPIRAAHRLALDFRKTNK